MSRTGAPLVVVAALAAGGCVIPAPPISGGSDLGVGAATRVAATARTRSDLLRELGPPVAIFSRGGSEPVMAAPSWSDRIPAAHFSRLQDAGPAFELFADVDPAAPDDVVYHWFRSRSTKTAVVAVVAVGEWSSTSFVRLWALVDPRSGAVRAVRWRADD